MSNLDIPYYNKPIFIIGCYRSGTSLLRLMLNAHSSIAIPEETHYIPIFARKINSYGNLSHIDNQRKLVKDILRYLRVKSRWKDMPILDDVVGNLPDITKYQDIIRTISLLSCSKKNVKYWGDKTPRYVHEVDCLNKIFPEAYFINVIRDGRDVAASVYDEPCKGGLTIIKIAEEWGDRVCKGRGAEFIIGHDRFIEVRYEELVTNPQEILNNLCDLLNINFEQEMLSFYASNDALELSRQSHHKKVTKPVSSSSVGSYIKRISESNIKDFESVSGKLLESLGYKLHNRAILLPPNKIKMLLDNTLRIIRYICYHCVKYFHMVAGNK